MLTLEEIRQKKEACGYTAEQLSKLSGVPLGTLQKVLANVTKSPRYETLQALSAVFEGRGGKKGVVYQSELAYALHNTIIAANWNTYDRQGTYTLEDYLALPEDQRVELIDGVFYDMGAPTIPHQLIGGLIYRRIAEYIEKRKGKCMPLIAPADVQLDCDSYTIVQPDVMIVCDRSKINRSRVFGAPEFVLEVLSPSTRKKDMLIKYMKYYSAGVKEYWMVNPMKEEVITYDFRDPEDIQLHLYTFQDKVPMMLYDGDLVIDFQEIKDYIADIPGRDEET